MTGESISGAIPQMGIDTLVEVYGENTAYVSAKDIEGLRDELPADTFAELSSRLGWDQLSEGEVQ